MCSASRAARVILNENGIKFESINEPVWQRRTDFLKINPDNALELTNQKFIKRFDFIESKAKELEKKLSYMSLSEMETIWKEAKNQSCSSDSNNF